MIDILFTDNKRSKTLFEGYTIRREAFPSIVLYSAIAQENLWIYS